MPLPMMRRLGIGVLALIAGRDALTVLIIMCLIGMAIDGFFMAALGESLPIWFRVAFVGAIPVGTFFVGLFVARGLHRFLRQTSAEA